MGFMFITPRLSIGYPPQLRKVVGIAFRLISFFSLLILAFNLASCASSSSVPITEAWRQSLASPTNYLVKKGDTLYSIAWNYGLDYRQVATLNKIKAPYHIKVGQKLRLESSSSPSTTPKPVKIQTFAPPKKPKESVPSLTPKTIDTSIEPEEIPPVTPAETDSTTLNTGKKSGILWAWPSRKGRLIQCFSCNGLNKGIDLAGNEGSPILAAAAGKVVYAGNGLRGYGEMLIIKHSDEFLSAYAHNQRLFVKEGQSVKIGQIIAFMGNTECKQVLLHFEIRQNGKPVDPLNYLPKCR